MFRLGDTEQAGAICGMAVSFSGGPAVVVQVQPNDSDSPYDIDHLC